jgi:CRP-like cAMP-binding protein
MEERNHKPRGETDMRSNSGIQAAGVGERPAGRLPESAGVRRHENRVLGSLPQADLALLARHLHVVTLQPGAVLQHQDHPLDHVYFPHDGLVSLLATTPEGGTIEAASVGRGGAVCPLHKSDLHDGFLTAVAQATMRVSRVAAAQLQAALTEIGALDRALRACREALLLQLRQNLVCGGLHAVEQRLSRWVLEAADRQESDVFPIVATQEHVAQRLGVRRTTVTLLASKLQDAGAIRWGRSRVEIVDRTRLESMACSCYASLRDRMAPLLPADPAQSTKPLAG